MEDIVLADAIERYLNGEMSESDRHHFEQMRQANADLDQMVVEHIFFLKQMDTYNDHYRFRENLDAIHAEVAGETKLVPLKPEGSKVVRFWNRYRRTVAVAATIAGLISISAVGLLLAYNKQNKLPYEELMRINNKIDNVSNKVDNLQKEGKTPRFQPNPNASFGGTGFIIDPRGYIVTNAHVAMKKNISVYNERVGSLKAELLFTDRENDLAIVKITDTAFKHLKPLPYGISKTEPEIGQEVFTLGYPRPIQIYHKGYISSRSANGTFSNPNIFLLNLQVESGNSGSPVINQKGIVTGIINSKETSQNGYATAIKPQALNSLLELLQRDEKITLMPFKPSLGRLADEEKIKKIEDYIFMIEVE